MQTTDKDILTAIRRDTNSGFALLVKTYTDTVYWHVRRLVESFNETEDVVQETFLRVFRSLDTFKGESSLRTWILRIATNESLRHIEKRQRDIGYFAENLDDSHNALAADEYIDYGDAMAVKFQSALDTLPPRQRAVFNLRYYDELPYNEIAEIMQISPESAKVSYHVAKDKIKNLLTK